MSTNIDLTTTALVKQHGRIETDPNTDLLVDRLVTASSDVFRTLTSRRITRATYTAEPHDGRESVRRGSRIYLREYPVNSVASVTEDGVALTVSTGYSVSALVTAFLPDGIIERQGNGWGNSGRWSSGVRNVVVTYNAGWDYPRLGGATTPATTDLPFDCEQAVAELAALMYREGQRVGEGSKTFGAWTVNYIRTLNPSIAAVIQAYSRSFRPAN